jgi:glycerol-3-phosphate dehydrogenase subunit C
LFKRHPSLTRSKPSGKKVAFFAGCTGQYLFPEVPMAAVEVLERNGIEVAFPEQKCCGMPSLLEGDRDLTYELARFNLERLSKAVEEGFDIVCSCPTCGYLLKEILSEGAFYGADETSEYRSGRTVSALPSRRLLKGLLRDEGYFAGLDARQRIRLSSHTYDLGEYLKRLHDTGGLATALGPIAAAMVYYPPCHLREQKIGEPYGDLLALIPEISLERIKGSFTCCGMAGIMGFKREFHETSLEMGRRLMDKINAFHPERLVTDCLSCRMQFNQCLPYPVLHPVEVLRDSYRLNDRIR